MGVKGEERERKWEGEEGRGKRRRYAVGIFNYFRF